MHDTASLAPSGMPPRQDGAGGVSPLAASGPVAGGVPEGANCLTIDGEQAMNLLEAAERRVLDALAAVDRLGRDLHEALITQAVAYEHDARMFPSASEEALDLARRYKADATLLHIRRRAILRIRRPIEDLR